MTGRMALFFGIAALTATTSVLGLIRFVNGLVKQPK